MKRFLGFLTLCLCLSVGSLAAAQLPIPYAEPSPTGSCFTGVHEGIADSASAAEKITRIVCDELRRQAPSYSGTYSVDVYQGGNGPTLSLVEIGRRGQVIRQRERPFENIQAVYREAPGMVSEMLRQGEHLDPLTQPVEMERSWYGWQTLMVDAPAIGLAALALKDKSRVNSNLMTTAGTLFCLGAPIVHLVNDNTDGAGLSLGMRAVALGGTALMLKSADDMGSGLAALVVGTLALEGAIAIDASYLARKKVPKKQATFAWNLSPSVGPSGGSLFLAGVF